MKKTLQRLLMWTPVPALIYVTWVDFAWAQTRNLQWYLQVFGDFINDIVIPLFFGLAILFFAVNVTRFFIIDASDASSREKAKKYMLYAIIALVILTSIWGIVDILLRGLGIDDGGQMCPDYIQNCDRNDGYWNQPFNPVVPPDFSTGGLRM